jgi:transketolase
MMLTGPAGHYDRLQIDGLVSEAMNIDPLDERVQSVRLGAARINGHDVQQIVDALSLKRKGVNKPLLVLAEALRGKGVSFMENVAGWHGKAPNHEEMPKGLRELGLVDKFPYASLLEYAEPYQRQDEDHSAQTKTAADFLQPLRHR